MEFETYADVIDAYNADNMGYSTLTDYIKEQNIKIKEIEMDPIGDMRRIFESKADGGRIGFDIGGSVIEKVASFFFDDEGNARSALQRAKFELSEFIAGKGTDLNTGAEWYNKLEPEEQREIIEEKIKYRERGELGGVPVYDEKYAGKFGIGGNYADGGSIGIEVLFKEKMANGGRVPAVSGGFLKLLEKGKKGIGSLFSKADDAADLAKQEEIFRSGPITKEFLETVDSKVINPFVRSRDAKGIGSYGLYDNFDEMPAGLKAAELISRIRKKGGGIDYEAAEFFLGKKLRGDESVDELIDIMLTEKKADGGRVGLFMGGPALEGQALSIYNSMNAYGFSDQEIADALSARGLYTPGGTTKPEQVTGIINQALNQNLGGGDGSDNRPQTNPRPAQTYTRTYDPNLNFAEFTSGVTGTPSYTQEYTKPETLFDLYQRFSPLGRAMKFFNDKKIEKQTLQNNAIAKAAAERAAKEAEAAALANAVTYQYNNPSQKAVNDPSGGNRADAFTGGGANVKAASYTSTGREGFGYGLKDGGLATMFTRRR